MDSSRMPSALRDRLGNEAAAALAELFTGVRDEWTADVIGIVSDRFERRLVEETSKLRLEIAAVRQEVTVGFSDVRQETASGFAAVRQEMTGLRFELLKWAFVFWVGQFFAVAGLIGVLVRFLRPGP